MIFIEKYHIHQNGFHFIHYNGFHQETHKVSSFKLQVSGTSDINASQYQIAFSTNQTGNCERTTREVSLSWILNINLLNIEKQCRFEQSRFDSSNKPPCSFHLLNLRTSSYSNKRNIAQGTTHPRLSSKSWKIQLRYLESRFLTKLQLQNLYQTVVNRLFSITINNVKNNIKKFCKFCKFKSHVIQVSKSSVS